MVDGTMDQVERCMVGACKKSIGIILRVWELCWLVSTVSWYEGLVTTGRWHSRSFLKQESVE